MRLAMSAFGTYSGHGLSAPHMSAFDPKRTSVAMADTTSQADAAMTTIR